MNKSQMSCPICGKKHNFFRIADLSVQLSVSKDSLQRRVSSIPHISVGKMRLIPECSISEIYKVHFPTDDLSNE